MNPSYLCGFCQSPLKTFDSQGTPSIEYTVCGKEEEEKKCPFFVKSSLLKDYCSVLLCRVKEIYKENPPYGQHGNTSTLYLSRSKDNFNRAFFKCANRADDDPFRYFQWADKEPNKFTLSQNHTRPGYLHKKPVLPSTPTKYKKKKEMKFLPAVKRITSIILPPDEELVAPKRKKRTEGILGKEENQERDSTTDHRVARREHPRSWYTVYLPRHSKYRTVV